MALRRFKVQRFKVQRKAIDLNFLVSGIGYGPARAWSGFFRCEKATLRYKRCRARTAIFCRVNAYGVRRDILFAIRGESVDVGHLVSYLSPAVDSVIEALTSLLRIRGDDFHVCSSQFQSFQGSSCLSCSSRPARIPQPNNSKREPLAEFPHRPRDQQEERSRRNQVALFGLAAAPDSRAAAWWP
jgi:hypothetical protein